MKILVIGGCGFLGTHLSNELVKKGHKVTVLDLKKKNRLNKKIKFIKGDLGSLKDLKKAFKGCSVVFHLGGISDIKYSIINPLKTIQTNILGTTNVLELCVKKRIKKVIFASTIYVKSSQGGFYKVSKQCSENLIKEYSKRYKLNYTIIRYGSVYGPGSSVNNGITKILNTFIKRKKLQYEGTKKAKRRFIYVADAVKASIRMIDEKFNNKSVLITGLNLMKIKDVMNKISKILKTNQKPKFKNKQELGHYNISPYGMKKDKTLNYFLENKKDFKNNINLLYKSLRYKNS